MTERGKDGWLTRGSAWQEEEFNHVETQKDANSIPMKTVMVYWMDQKNTRREPIGILAERRRLERDNNNAIGMLRLARKVFARSEEEAKRIMIGEYV